MAFQRNSNPKTTVSFKIAHSIRQIVIPNFSPVAYSHSIFSPIPPFNVYEVVYKASHDPGHRRLVAWQ